MARFYDRIKQLCDATFTGNVSNIRIDYANAAMNGYRRFGDVVPLGTTVFYVVESTDTTKDEWECGYGVFDFETISGNSRRTITRNVLSGSNGTSKVNFTAGEKVVYIATLARLVDGQVKHTFTGATQAPNETFDVSMGYEKGSMYFYSDAMYFCIDPSAGAANWLKIATGNALVNNLGIVSVLAVFDQTPTGMLNGPQSYGGLAMSLDNNQTYIGTWAVNTSDATPTPMVAAPGGAPSRMLDLTDLNCCGALEAVVVAVSAADRKAWKVTCGFGRTSGGVLTLGTPTITQLHATAGASAWDVDVVDVGAAGNIVGIEVTGAAATDIGWFSDFKSTIVYVPAF